jgi:hypothetical protein
MSNTETTDQKVLMAFRCSAEMQDFLKKVAGEESVSSVIRAWIREKMTEQITSE